MAPDRQDEQRWPITRRRELLACVSLGRCNTRFLYWYQLLLYTALQLFTIPQLEAPLTMAGRRKNVEDASSSAIEARRAAAASNGTSTVYSRIGDLNGPSMGASGDSMLKAD